MKLTKDELRIIDIALLFEIEDQEKILNMIRNETSLESYLHQTKLLHQKVKRHLSQELKD